MCTVCLCVCVCVPIFCIGYTKVFLFSQRGSLVHCTRVSFLDDCETNITDITTTTTTTIEFVDGTFNVTVGGVSYEAGEVITGLTPGDVYEVTVSSFNCCMIVTTSEYDIVHMYSLQLTTSVLNNTGKTHFCLFFLPVRETLIHDLFRPSSIVATYVTFGLCGFNFHFLFQITSSFCDMAQ